MWMKRVVRTGIALSVVVLAACGGGGGGGGSAAEGGTPSADGKVLVQGVATFDSVPNTSGKLDYTATTVKPIRGATVEILGTDGQVLANGTSSDGGAYALTVPANTSVSLRVRAQLLRTGAPGWDVTVRDNTASDAIYAVASSAFDSGAQATLQRDIQAPSGWNGSGYDTARAAGPFALLDTIYGNVNKVLSVAPSTTFPALRIFWSVNNTTASGNPALGQIGTTFFTTGSGASRAIYVLGKADVDTDEYDVSVVSHEWGHYYQSAFSRDDSPGGAHSSADLLDRRLAFSEGWGNAWSGIALGRSTYTDSVGAGQASGLTLDLSTGPPTNPGWFRERSIQSILWNLERAAGFAAIHNTLTGPFKAGLPVTSIHPFTVAFANAAPAQIGTLTSLLAAQSISTSTTDSYGGTEANNGGVPAALPLYTQTPASVCVTNQAGSGNKLGHFAYLRFTLATAGPHQIVVTGPGGTDPDFDIYQGGRINGSYGTASGVENATLTLPAGESLLVLEDANQTASCFAVTIN